SRGGSGVYSTRQLSIPGARRRVFETRKVGAGNPCVHLRRLRSALSTPKSSERCSPAEGKAIEATVKEKTAISIAGGLRAAIALVAIERANPDFLSYRVAKHSAEDSVRQPMSPIDHAADADADRNSVRRN